VTAAELIRRCEQAGILLVPHGDILHVEAPKGLLTPELCERLRAHKPAIIAELRAWDQEADQILVTMYKRVAAAFDLRPWSIPGAGDDAHQSAIEAACRRRDIGALRAAAERYVQASERFARALAEAVPVDQA
jgi:hypothetical protein